MAEESFPVIEQPMTADQWASVTRGIGDGVIDEGGGPYRLSGLSNSSNTATIGVDSAQGFAHAILRGFYHKITDPVTIELPAVTTATTYYVVLQYQPTRSDMPVKLQVVTSLDYSQDQVYLILHTVRREPNQLLTDATVASPQPRVAPTVLVYESAELPDVRKVLYGTVAIVHSEADIKVARAVGGQAIAWRSILYPDWETLSLPSNRKHATSGNNVSIQRVGKRRYLRGRISPTGDDFRPITPGTAAYYLVNLPSRDRPSKTWGGFGQVTGFASPGFARLEISSGDGVLYGAPSKQTGWIGFDGLFWDVD